MKKLVGMAICLILSQGVSAQSFWKKIGKAAGKIAGQVLDNSTSDTGSKVTNFGDVQVKNNISNLDVEYKGVIRKGNDAVVVMTFTNTGTVDIDLRGLTKRSAYDANGTELEHGLVIGRAKMYSGDPDYTFPPGVPVRTEFWAGPIPDEECTLGLLRMEPADYTGNPARDGLIEIRNVTVPKAEVGFFKGVWRKDYSDSSVYFDLDFYGKSVKYDEQPCYGILGFCSLSRIDEHAITSVKITGNTAVVTGKCSYSDATFKGQLTYNQADKSMKYESLGWENSEDILGCFIPESVTLPLSK